MMRQHIHREKLRMGANSMNENSQCFIQWLQLSLPLDCFVSRFWIFFFLFLFLFLRYEWMKNARIALRLLVNTLWDSHALCSHWHNPWLIKKRVNEIEEHAFDEFFSIALSMKEIFIHSFIQFFFSSLLHIHFAIVRSNSP